MSNPPESSKQEHPSTYFVQDRTNLEELERVTVQDQMITASMGGILPEQADPSAYRRVLDVACGSGGWVIEAAQTYPTMTLIGIDVSKRMVDYAREQAEKAQVADRVEFHVMDALRMLEFPNNYFDLVNMRCSGSFMRTWDWPKMLSEMLRIARPQAVIRVTEPEIEHQNNSPALTQFFAMFQCAMFQSGHLFENNTTGIIDHLARLLTQHGCQQVQTRSYALEYRTGTPAGQAYYNDCKYVLRNLKAFIQKWGCISGDYEAICKQALEEMQQDTFHSTWNLRTAWGYKSR
ncbi:class I SAM-dependent methyltransferase [Ktedonosporobacter rubrisoli]|uniref:Class I SAM-dependent methyltransferase n=1 Tax=Ktedonosporobacter rubrisoli TaxID=2509675 RepID=A0A4P6JUA8_KTERU|nr:class I SAM-dependent methyltransferase [Ktedonosporobacter rubrisoli]QBD79209.1 class I SAM-dependent methyltransferase [Ktedonosporobacter rubrisoli]